MKIITSIFKGTVTFVIATIATLILMEMFLQGAEIRSRGVTRYDSVLGTALKSDRKVVRFNEGFYMGRTNEYGYYGRAYPEDKKPDRPRIALIGDSHVEAHQLFHRDYFGAVMEQRFAAAHSVTTEVLNFGRTGLNLSDMYCYYKDFTSKFSPDITVFILGPKDLDRSPPRQLLPYCYVDGDSLKINYDFAQSTVFKSRLRTSFLRGTSAVLNMVSVAREVAAKGLGPEIVWGKFYRGHEEKRNDDDVFSLSKTTLRILQELGKDQNVYLVLTGAFTAEVTDMVSAANPRIIHLEECLDAVEDPRFWVATDKLGHWNHEAHKAIGRHIADMLYSPNRE